MAEEQQEQVVEEVTAVESAPELDEHVETYVPPSKVTINKRKQLLTRISGARTFAQKNDIGFVAFFEGPELPLQISAHADPGMIQMIVAHLAVYFNRDFNEAIELVRNNFQTKPYDATEQPDEPSEEGGA